MSLKDRLIVAAVLYRMCALGLTILSVGYMILIPRPEVNWHIQAMGWNAVAVCLWLDQLCIMKVRKDERKEHEEELRRAKSSNN